MPATSPEVRNSVTSLSEETTRTEREAQKLLRDIRPLIVYTLNEVRDVTHTSNSLLSQIHDLISP